MFKNKLLKALLAPFFVFVDDEGTGGGAGGDSGGYNISSMVDDIGSGLGFSSGDNDEPSGLDTDPGNDPTVDDGAGTGTSGAATPNATDSPDDGSGVGAANNGSPTPAVDVPKTWRPEAAAEWAKLPPVVQSEILKREQDIFQGLEGYKADAQLAKGFKSAFAQFEPILQQSGLDPVMLTREFMQAHYVLATGTPEQKQALLNRMVTDYGLQDLLPSGGEAPYVDPSVAALQNQIKALESKLSGTEQRQAQIERQKAEEVRGKLASEIDAFAKDPKNLYFDEVLEDITGFVRMGMDLKAAYDKAVWANPVTRAKEIARTTAEQRATAEKEAAEKAKAARQATAANVRTTAKNASGTAPLGSMDDTLKEAYARLTKRS